MEFWLTSPVSNVYRGFAVTIPVSCRRNTLSLLRVSPHRSMLEDQSGSRGPSTPRSVGEPLDLGQKQIRNISNTFFKFQLSNKADTRHVYKDIHSQDFPEYSAYVVRCRHHEWLGMKLL